MELDEQRLPGDKEFNSLVPFENNYALGVANGNSFYMEVREVTSSYDVRSRTPIRLSAYYVGGGDFYPSITRIPPPPLKNQTLVATVLANIVSHRRAKIISAL